MKLVKVIADSTRAREETGLRSALSLSRAQAQKAMEHTLEYTGEVAVQGDMMARPERYRPSDCIRSYAELAWDAPRDFNVTRIPRSPVDFRIVYTSLQKNMYIKVSGQVDTLA